MDPAFWFMGHPLVRAGEGVQSQGARSTWDLKGDLGGWGVPPPPLDPRLNAISLPHSACSLLPIHKFPKFLVILAFSGKNAQNIIKVPLSPRAFSPFFSQVWRKNGLNGLSLKSQAQAQVGAQTSQTEYETTPLAWAGADPRGASGAKIMDWWGQNVVCPPPFQNRTQCYKNPRIGISRPTLDFGPFWPPPLKTAGSAPAAQERRRDLAPGGGASNGRNGRYLS